ADRPLVGRRVLELTNLARSRPRRCGSELFPAAPPLVPAPASLERAAQEHSEDMARHDYMDHTGRDGSTPAQRVTRSGYR
ncbi:CAP domain-containing protein, partial [Acinetobacter baumannii]